MVDMMLHGRWLNDKLFGQMPEMVPQTPRQKRHGWSMMEPPEVSLSQYQMRCSVLLPYLGLLSRSNDD